MENSVTKKERCCDSNVSFKRNDKRLICDNDTELSHAETDTPFDIQKEITNLNSNSVELNEIFDKIISRLDCVMIPENCKSEKDSDKNVRESRSPLSERMCEINYYLNTLKSKMVNVIDRLQI